MVINMKIALAAVCYRNREIAFNVSQMKKWMREAKNHGADLVCFGETFLQGFDALTWNFEEDKTIAVPADGAVFDDLKSATAEIGIDLLFGYNELDGDAIYSSAALLGNGELIHNYRRITKGWKEYYKTDDHYREGDKPVVFGYRGLNCLIALCGDLWDRTEDFALGEDVLFWPLYITYTPAEWRKEGEQFEYALKASEAAETTLLINSLSDTNDAYGGCSWFDCGEIREHLEMGREGLLYVEV